jgi:geranylgeranyl pyrophosphate synthase
MKRSLSHQRLLEQFEMAAKAETQRWTAWPDRLAEACSYVFLGGGKRIRPVLSLSCARLFGEAEVAMPWSLAVELIHTYSLVHDDLPAMDDDDERRGKPTCHRKYDEGTAVLAGDALLTRAFELLCEDEKPASVQIGLIRLLSEASGGAGMVGGQVDDLFGDLSAVDNLVGMQMKKTGALLSASAVGGAMAAGADPTSLKQIQEFGNSLGLLFQLTDDMIDKAQDAERDSNNFHHHMSDEAVLKWRDELIAGSLQNLEALPADTTELAALIHGIGERRV